MLPFFQIKKRLHLEKNSDILKKKVSKSFLVLCRELRSAVQKYSPKFFINFNENLNKVRRRTILIYENHFMKLRKNEIEIAQKGFVFFIVN